MLHDIVSNGAKEISLRGLGLEIGLVQLKNFLQGNCNDTLKGIEEKTSQQSCNDGDNFKPNINLKHLDVQLTISSWDIEHVIKAIFARAPMLSSLTLDRWSLSDCLQHPLNLAMDSCGQTLEFEVTGTT
ncbi:hypothetical protein HDU76_013362 [Blyttiomyces sp. JEL0837]|nr:hypothetical protein HDU76_013362 [Blyttiomyces sp. JEL0837]